MADAGAMRVAAYTARVRRGAFTLIELLVVIAIIALLMAILVPTLRRVRQQGRAVVCRAHLRQWGMLEAVYVDENEGRLPLARVFNDVAEAMPSGFGYPMVPDLGEHGILDGAQCCPAASKLANPEGIWSPSASDMGGTFLAWGRLWPKTDALAKVEVFAYGSYGWNTALISYPWEEVPENSPWVWKRAYVRGAERIPVQSAAVSSLTTFEPYFQPPSCEPTPSIDALKGAGSGIASASAHVCMNRHDGGVNALFLDWSVRKVGLKELWTLKWNKPFDTRGHWTTAGGAEPDDWPKWMRGFKDY